jgi:hypothetical protein
MISGIDTSQKATLTPVKTATLPVKPERDI